MSGFLPSKVNEAIWIMNVNSNWKSQPLYFNNRLLLNLKQYYLVLLKRMKCWLICGKWSRIQLGYVITLLWHFHLFIDSWFSHLIGSSYVVFCSTCTTACMNTLLFWMCTGWYGELQFRKSLLFRSWYQ